MVLRLDYQINSFGMFVDVDFHLNITVHVRMQGSTLTFIFTSPVGLILENLV